MRGCTRRGGVHPRICKSPIDNMTVILYNKRHMNTKAQDPSTKRKHILALIKEAASLVYKLIKILALSKGTIYTHQRKCGNKNCKCSRGQLHSTKALSFSHAGKTHYKSLTKCSFSEFSQLEKQVKQYQKFRRYRSRIVFCFRNLITEINNLEQCLLTTLPTKGVDYAPEKPGREN